MAVRICWNRPRRQHDLGELERDRPPMLDDPGADLHQPAAQRSHRPLCCFGRQRQGAQEVGEVIGQRMKLKPHGIRLKAMAG